MADVKLNIDQWKKFAEAIAISTDQKRIDEAKANAVRLMAAAYLREAKTQTPTGARGTVEVNGKEYRIQTEHMRRSWDTGKLERGARVYQMAVTNSASYASFVNDGHRQTPGRFVPILGKQLVANFVGGQHMAEKAQAYTESKAGGIIRRQTSALLKELKNGGK
ncbi:MAG: HK97 gp10 family phage protein [Negativicoccus succinicivorans]|uniref:HK97 gp10 family phage protein n=1 Tax=Negativicoccus succinicivorans TaxID=620903 RepID=UPI002357BCE3|nr:HK97 gp10 family phage protein [Negativicoccus succinicivorans]MBS5890660.1 HK97 gp10 family phage protein [Negativicoccus succinicivorans]